jgi:hypothetical protein
MSETLDKIKDAERDLGSYKRELLAGLLNQCTEQQQSLFYRMYKSITDMPDKQINWAIIQCENTIKANDIKVVKI